MYALAAASAVTGVDGLFHTHVKRPVKPVSTENVYALLALLAITFGYGVWLCVLIGSN